MGKKILAAMLIAVVCISSMGLIGCNEKKEVKKENKVAPFVGKWECEDNPLNDPGNYTGYLVLEVKSDGSLSVYDAQTEKSGMMGKIKILSDDELEFTGDEKTALNPPPTWAEMTDIQIFTYRFKSEGKLYLTFTDREEDESSTLIFDKVNK